MTNQPGGIPHTTPQVENLRGVIAWQEAEIVRLRGHVRDLLELLGPGLHSLDERSQAHFDRYIAGDR